MSEDIHSLLARVISLELLHDNLQANESSPDLAVWRLSISFNQSFLSSGALVQHGLTGIMSAEVSKAEIVTKKTASQLWLMSKKPLGRRESSN